MKTNLWNLILCAGCSFAAGLTASAVPLARPDLPADPAWLLHIDFDGLRPTTIGQFIQSQLDKPEAQAKLAVFQAVFSIDLRKQLHGVTLYGASPVPEEGVLLVYADFDPNRLVTLARAANEYQSSSHNQHTIHSWLDENKKDKSGNHPRVYAAIQGPRVIFGQREAPVAAALDVLDGTAPNLASSKNFPQLGAPGKACFILGGARKLDFPDSDPNAAILRLSRQIRLEIGEADSRLAATLTLDANDDQIAQHVASIAQGLVALMKLQRSKPEATKLADAIALKQDGVSVVATLNLPASDVVDILKAGAARKAEKAEKAQKE